MLEAPPLLLPDTGEPGFGLYVHWPFCAAKCPYCDFNSHVRHQPVDQPRFVSAFLREMEEMRRLSGPKTVTSIFLGGGTPSLMDPATVGAILDGIARQWHVPDGIEITMEANPSSVEATRFRGYRAAGVNRASLGVQALNDPDLKFLGRLHDVEDALKAIRLAREIFPRMSFDLIYARPHQTVEAWEKELRQAISYAVDHLSLYQLTIEEGTAFFGLHKAGKFIVPDEEQAALLYEATQEITGSEGLPAYEVSNHARPGAESRHNLTYWRYGDYAGIGPGAHGRLTRGRDKLATATERNPEGWLAARRARRPWHDRPGIAGIGRAGRRTAADGTSAARRRGPGPLAAAFRPRSGSGARADFTGTRVHRTPGQFAAALHAEGDADPRRGRGRSRLLRRFETRRERHAGRCRLCPPRHGDPL